MVVMDNRASNKMATATVELNKAIIDIFVQLPLYHYVSAAEIRMIMVGQLDVSTTMSPDYIQCAMKFAVRGSAVIDIRRHTKKNTRFYAVASRSETCVLFPNRSADWTIPILQIPPFESGAIAVLSQQIINDELTKMNGNDRALVDDMELRTHDDIVPPSDIPAPNVNMVFCKGFRGEKIDELFKQSFVDGPLREYKLGTPFPRSFFLPSSLSTHKGAGNLHFQMHDDLCWSLTSRSCAHYFSSSKNQRQAYCEHCQALRNDVKNLCHRINTKDYGNHKQYNHRISDKDYLEMAVRPEKMKALLEEVRGRHHKQLQSMRREHAHALQKAMDEHSASIEISSKNDDVQRGKEAFRLLKPVIENKYGTNSEATLIWEQMIEGMSRPLEAKPRYNNAALLFGIELAAQTKADVYEKLASLICLPPRNHCKRVQRKIIYGREGCYKTGFQEKTVELFHQHCMEKGFFTNGPMAVCLAFDAMVMKKSFLLSTRNVDKGRIIGCVATDDLPTLQRHFESFVQNVTQQARKNGDVLFKETILDPFEHNREHLVCYARCITPGIDVSFIVGAWNLPTCRKIDLVPAIYDVILGLFQYEFEARVITCDNAQANEGFYKTMATIKAKDLMDNCSWLDEFDLKGDFLIGREHPITNNPIIFISDPPHCLKRLACAVRTRALQYNGCPMTGQLLHDVWRAVQSSQGKSESSLMVYRKFQSTDFLEGNAFQAMNVASASRLFSATTKKMIDEFASNPQAYPMEEKLQKDLDREAFFSKIGELVTIVNEFFDLCNGKEGLNMFVTFHAKNAEKYAKQFLRILKWFVDWETSLKVVLPFPADNFITTETFRSLKYICYGFACLMKTECLDKSKRISPCKINQDICEHHFANVRRNCASHANPNEVECMAAVMQSAFFRLDKVRKSNCGPITKEHQRSLVPLQEALKDSTNQCITSKKKRANSMTELRSGHGKRLRSKFNNIQNKIDTTK